MPHNFEVILNGNSCENKVTSSSIFAFNISTVIYSNRVCRVRRETLRKFSANVSISVMTIRFSDDLTGNIPRSRASKSAGTWRRWKERLPL